MLIIQRPLRVRAASWRLSFRMFIFHSGILRDCRTFLTTEYSVKTI